MLKMIRYICKDSDVSVCGCALPIFAQRLDGTLVVTYSFVKCGLYVLASVVLEFQYMS